MRGVTGGWGIVDPVRALQARVCTPGAQDAMGWYGWARRLGSVVGLAGGPPVKLLVGTSRGIVG